MTNFTVVLLITRSQIIPSSPDSIDFSLSSGGWTTSPRCPPSPSWPPLGSGSPKESKSSQNLAYFYVRI